MNAILIFVAGAVLCNGLPHLFAGLRGEAFPTPFAKPPGRGLSPPVVNALWSAVNLVVGSLILAYHPVAVGLNRGFFAFCAGALLAALGLAWHFGRVRVQEGR